MTIMYDATQSVPGQINKQDALGIKRKREREHAGKYFPPSSKIIQIFLE